MKETRETIIILYLNRDPGFKVLANNAHTNIIKIKLAYSHKSPDFRTLFVKISR